MSTPDMPEIPDREIAMYAHYLFDSIDGLLACLDGLDEQQLNWRPPTATANSLYVLAVHVLANVEETVLKVLGGLPVARDRDAEFVAEGPTSAALRARWADLRARIWVQLAALPSGALDAEYDHPRRGRLTGHAVLLVVTRHAAEHLGHAELTRDLLTAIRR